MIQLDLNNPEFQANLLAMNKPEAWAILKTLRLLQAMSWEQLQRSKGLRWELIQSRQGPGGMEAGCACSHSIPITIRGIDHSEELHPRGRAC